MEVAPLLDLPEAPAPAGARPAWFAAPDGRRLRAVLFPATAPVRGSVVLSPGRTEPIEKYFETIGELQGRGFVVLAHDWRGQGLSARLLPDRLKCHARSTDEFLDDYQRLLDTFEERAPKPWIMLGHSMGAALNLATLVKGEIRIAGAFFTNPMLRVKTGRHSLWSVNFQTNWQVNHGRGTDYVPELFNDPFEDSFEEDALTHDAARYEVWHEQLFACPHLAVGSPTWGWLAFALKLGEGLLKEKALKKVKTPVTLLCSGDDNIVNKQPTKQFARKLGKGQYVEIVGAEHEIHIEADDYRVQAMNELDTLLDHVAPRAGAGRADDADAGTDRGLVAASLGAFATGALDFDGGDDGEEEEPQNF